jgi:hypothetical protein
MATIRAPRQSDGTIRYAAIVRLRQGKTVLHYESETFSQRSAANSWAKSREVALEEPSSTLRQNNKPRTLASLIRWYIDTFETVPKWQRSKQTHLLFLERHRIAQSNALAITAGQLIKHIQERRAEGTGPATVANDLTWIASFSERPAVSMASQFGLRLSRKRAPRVGPSSVSPTCLAGIPASTDGACEMAKPEWPLGLCDHREDRHRAGQRRSESRSP